MSKTAATGRMQQIAAQVDPAQGANEHGSERTTEDEIDSSGFTIGGRSTRTNPWKPGMEYRVLWIDA